MFYRLVPVILVFSGCCFGLNQDQGFNGRQKRDMLDDETRKESSEFGTRAGYPDGIEGETKRVRGRTTNSPAVSREPKSTIVNGDPLQTNEIRDGTNRGPPTVEVKEISCMKMSSREKFVATIVGPAGQQIFPLFEGRPGIDPKTSRVCQIVAGSRSGTHKMEITNLDSCGVQVCPQDNQPWLCLTLRIPVVPGLKLPEDELILVKCKPQDRMVSEKKESDFNGASLAIQAAAVERRNPLATFSGGKQDFLCEIGIFRRLPGTALFSQRVTTGSLVDLGEEVQLRSIVRSGDGWNYSKLTDVVVRRLRRDKNVVTETTDIANLVYADGCRNPAFKMIAPGHPQRDGRNTLLENFNFRVFLFQDMEDGDSILVSARVLACVEGIDCAPSLCADDRQQGFGRRRRSVQANIGSGKNGEIREIVVHRRIHENGTEESVSAQQLKGWEADMAVKVLMPRNSFDAKFLDPIEHHCFLYIIIATALGTALGVVVLVLVFYCACKGRPKHVEQTKYPQPQPPPAQSKLTEIYNEIELLDVLSRTIRDKKQRVHEEILGLYEKREGLNENRDGLHEKRAGLYEKDGLYEKEEAKSVRQLKRRSGVITSPKMMNNGGYITNVNFNALSDSQPSLMAQV